jgi:hypothetical protein
LKKGTRKTNILKLKFNLPIDIDTDILSGWHTLSNCLTRIHDHDTLIKLLKYELSNNKRDFIINRLRSRIIQLSINQTKEQIDDFIKANKI